MIAFWAGAACGAGFGWCLCARLGRPAVEAKDRTIDLLFSAVDDLEEAVARWEGIAHRQTRKRIMAEIARTPVHQDDGSRLLHDISDAYLYAERQS